MRAFVTGGSGFVGRELIQQLRALGHEVVAIGRSQKSRDAVTKAGARAVEGDLDNVDALTKGMQGCDWVFHSAAHTEEWDTEENFFRVNVTGTDNVMNAAKIAGVARFVLISSEAVLADGNPIINADETKPLPAKPLPGYPSTKGECERRVLAMNGKGLETVIVRPRFIWGRNDTSNLVKFLEALENGRFKWISGGTYLTSTTHVQNACEGAILAAEKGKPGEIYFVTDGKPVEFRWFMSEVVKTQKREPPKGSVPRGVVRAVAAVTEGIWRTFKLKGAPPATKIVVGLMGQEVTINDSKARRELGYVGKMSIEEGLAEMARLPPVA